MTKIISLSVMMLLSMAVSGQNDTVSVLTSKTYMIPMRDGVKLFTRVLSPLNYAKPVPILLNRTPYGIYYDPKKDSLVPVKDWDPYYGNLARSGYILVFQDIRGKFKSEGRFEMFRGLNHLKNKSLTDESTDAWDTVDWLIKNITNNNGKVGIMGISYDGFLALQAAVDPHPALMASSPQAAPADMFLGDDFHHNGAFRLSYGFEYTYMVEKSDTANSNFPFPTYDLFDWYLKLGSLKNVNEKLYKGTIPTWNNFQAHPDYDDFWKSQSSLINIKSPQIPLMHVGGYYDQEDLNGPQAMYQRLEKNDSANRNYLVLGPWDHGGWAGPNGDSLGSISFRSKTSTWFAGIQQKWFDYWLKNIRDEKIPEAYLFRTGINSWDKFDQWPAANTSNRKLFLNADLSAGFEMSKKQGQISFTSDPAKPVPYRPLPIEATYGEGSRWHDWQVTDQRFVSSRPDVISFSADTLTENMTISGNIVAHIFAATTGTDADFVVKLIDVYPDFDTSQLSMSGYQFPVTMEVFRGKFRKSYSNPLPFTPGKPEQVIIDLHNVNHTFLKGHRIMVQIQSTWFPLIDRNPQKFLPNIFAAKESDFVKAVHTLYCQGTLASFIELPVKSER